MNDQCAREKNGALPGTQETYQGEERILGLRGFRWSQKNQGKNEDLTLWYSPEINCEVIKLSVQRFDSTGKAIGTFEREPTKITFQEPPKALFDIPQSYKETLPSELMRHVVASRSESQVSKGLPAAPSEPATIKQGYDKWDKWYLESNKKR
jgi:hypothetical protein